MPLLGLDGVRHKPWNFIRKRFERINSTGLGALEMNSNALVRIRNTTLYSYFFEVDVAKPVKIVSRLTIPPNGSIEVGVEYLTALTYFSREFQNAVASGNVVLTFNYTTFRGLQSTASNFLANMTRFFDGNGLGWQIS